MKKYILFFAILLATQVHAQRGGWAYFFTRGGNTISQANTLDTLKLNNLKMPAGTSGHVLTINAAGNVTTQAVGASSIGANSIDSTHVKSDGLTSDDIRPNAIGASEIDETANINWTGTHTFDDFVKKADMLEFLGAGLEETVAAGAADSTVHYMPCKMFSLSDTAVFDFSTSKRFASLDSIIILGGTISTLGDSAAFSVQVKQTQLSGAYTGAFNAAAIDSSDLGAGNVQRFWRFASFGSVTASVRSTIRVKAWRSACTNNTGSDVYVERVLIYGIGLR